jgi:hypothetical protein
MWHMRQNRLRRRRRSSRRRALGGLQGGIGRSHGVGERC